jgi:hypothetical protein
MKKVKRLARPNEGHSRSLVVSRNITWITRRILNAPSYEVVNFCGCTRLGLLNTAFME